MPLNDSFEGCGIGKIWMLTHSDPFTTACLIHDYEFDKNERNDQLKTRKQVDKEFLKNMLVAAAGSKYMKMRAYVFYGLARAFGGMWW